MQGFLFEGLGFYLRVWGLGVWGLIKRSLLRVSAWIKGSFLRAPFAGLGLENPKRNRERHRWKDHQKEPPKKPQTGTSRELLTLHA